MEQAAPGTPTYVVLHTVCPALGAAIALVMFCSPLKAVLEVNKRRFLGEVNALPFAAMAVNCASWILYGAVISDFFVYCANIPGLMLGLFYTQVCYKFSTDSAQNVLTGIYLAASALFFTIGLVQLAAMPGNPDGGRTLWGATAVGVLALYYSAPLTSVAKVLRTRDSSSLYWPLCTANVVNGALWFSYGLAIKDFFIAAPNGVGAAFNIVCVVLCVLVPRRPSQAGEGSDGDSGGSGSSELAHSSGRALPSGWDAVRLQSSRWSALPLDGAAPPQAGAGGGTAKLKRQTSFFDVTSMRWRHGGGGGRAPGPAPLAFSGLLGALSFRGGAATSGAGEAQAAADQQHVRAPAGCSAKDVFDKDVEAGVRHAQPAGAPTGIAVLGKDLAVVGGTAAQGARGGHAAPGAVAGPALSAASGLGGDDSGAAIEAEVSVVLSGQQQATDPHAHP